MKQLKLFLMGLCLAACSTQSRDNLETQAAAGGGDADSKLARRVSGTWLLSTDYRYQERCNYLPEEFVKNLFNLGKDVELAKYSGLDNCELRWGSNKIAFYLESKKPFESTFQSEYYFNKLFDPQSNNSNPGGNPAEPRPSIHGPAPEGTNAEMSATSQSTSTEQDSTRGADPSAPLEGMTAPTPPIATPAKNTATGEAVTEVGDKAIWEPGKKALHVLYNNHVFSVVVQAPGSMAQARKGAIGLAKLITQSLDDPTDARHG